MPDIAWISVKDKLPEECEHVLLSDGEKQWVGMLQKVKDRMIWFASHPDYERYKNKFAAPYLTESQLTHWMPLSEPPKD